MIGRRRGGRAIHWAEAFGMSIAFHVGAAVLVLDFVADTVNVQLRDSAPPELTVTSLSLDADTLSAATLSDPDPGAEAGEDEGAGDSAPDDAEPATEAEIAEPVAPEIPEDSASDLPEPAPEPESPEIAEAEVLEPADPVPEAEEPAPEIAEPDTPAPETLADAVEPDALTAESAEPETLAAITPELAPETLDPVTPPEEPAALAPVTPLLPDEDSALAALTPITPAAPAPQRLSAVAPRAPAPAPRSDAGVASVTGVTTVARVAPRQTARPASNRPAPAPATARPSPPAPGSPEAAVSELVRRIRGRLADPCLVAMPQQAPDGAPELVLLAASEAGLRDYAADVLAGVTPTPRQRAVLVDARQCPALNYIRENRAYPGFRLSIGLASDRLADATPLVGALGGAAGRYVSLLLVDDNGVVQDLGTYLRFSGDQAEFEVPLRRAGTARDTGQLLLGLATGSRPVTLDRENGQSAAVFFAALRGEIGTDPPLVLIPFDVR